MDSNARSTRAWNKSKDFTSVVVVLVVAAAVIAAFAVRVASRSTIIPACLLCCKLEKFEERKDLPCTFFLYFQTRKQKRARRKTNKHHRAVKKDVQSVAPRRWWRSRSRSRSRASSARLESTSKRPVGRRFRFGVPAVAINKLRSRSVQKQLVRRRYVARRTQMGGRSNESENGRSPTRV